MLAAGATETDFKEARQVMRESAWRQHPGYRYVSQRTEQRGKIMAVICRFEYSRWEALKRRVLSIFSREPMEQQS